MKKPHENGCFHDLVLENRTRHTTNAATPVDKSRCALAAVISTRPGVLSEKGLLRWNPSGCAACSLGILLKMNAVERSRAVCTVALPLLAVWISFGQVKKAPTRIFKPPMMEGYVQFVVLAKDEGCAVDYVKTSKLSGLELRKQLTDLATYGCIEKLDHLYHAYLKEGKAIPSGKDSVFIRRVVLVMDVDAEREIFGSVSDVTSENVRKEGWILDRDILKLTRADAIAFYKSMLKEGKEQK
jgi:hypothetical protein